MINHSNYTIVDTPFLTVLKTWTSSFEHSMIIHARVRFEFPKVSAVRLALGSLNLFVLCLGMDQGLVVLLLREECGLWAIPSTHRLRLCAIGHVFLPSAISVGRSALFLVDRHSFWLIGHIFEPRPFHLLFADVLWQLVSTILIIHTRVWRDLIQDSSLFNKLENWNSIRREAVLPFQRFWEFGIQVLHLSLHILPLSLV